MWTYVKKHVYMVSFMVSVVWPLYGTQDGLLKMIDVKYRASIVVCVGVGVCVCSGGTLSCVQLCNPMDYSLPGSSVHGIFQARILERHAIFFSRGSSWLRDRTHVSSVSCTGGQIPDHCATWEATHLLLPVFKSTTPSPGKQIKTQCLLHGTE